MNTFSISNLDMNYELPIKHILLNIQALLSIYNINILS